MDGKNFFMAVGWTIRKIKIVEFIHRHGIYVMKGFIQGWWYERRPIIGIDCHQTWVYVSHMPWSNIAADHHKNFFMKALKFAATVIIASAIFSCKKNNDKKAECRIVTITASGSGDNTIYNLTYNNEGNISVLSTSGTSGTTKVFNYNGNTVIATSANSNGDFQGRDSITLDAKRKPLNIRSFSDEDGTNFTNSRFEYNGDDLLKIHTLSSGSTTPETQVATSVNGNMVSLTANSSTSTLEYFTDKKLQQGDFLNISNFIQYGLSIYPHKNLVKTIASGTNILNFNYEFNPDGTISRVTATSGTTVSTVSYQYQCN
jgi:hypothetical protein